MKQLWATTAGWQTKEGSFQPWLLPRSPTGTHGLANPTICSKMLSSKVACRVGPETHVHCAMSPMLTVARGRTRFIQSTGDQLPPICPRLRAGQRIKPSSTKSTLLSVQKSPIFPTHVVKLSQQIRWILPITFSDRECTRLKGKSTLTGNQSGHVQKWMASKFRIYCLGSTRDRVD